MNDRFYNALRTVPEEAKKSITGGRLKGMTDINPMWRIKRLTEVFGPCGIGWWYEVTNHEIVDDAITHQSAAFVDILLYYVDPETGETSHGIPGTGGASFVCKEKDGFYLSDECFKMALTDAISVAAKALGVAADVYFAKDRTKYTAAEDEPKKETKPKATKKEEPKNSPMACPVCGETVTARTDKKGKEWMPIDILKAYGGMCPACYKRMNDESKNN